MTPYFTQHSPPALVAMLPPIEQISYDDGSGGYQRPCSAAAALTSALKAPASTTATLAATSISIERIRSRLTTMPSGDRRGSAGEATASPAGHHRYAVLGCPADGGLDLCCAKRADHRHRSSGRRIAGPVEAVVLGGDGIGSNGITESRDELLQRSLHAPQISPTRAAHAEH